MVSSNARARFVVACQLAPLGQLTVSLPLYPAIFFAATFSMRPLAFLVRGGIEAACNRMGNESRGTAGAKVFRYFGNWRRYKCRGVRWRGGRRGQRGVAAENVDTCFVKLQAVEEEVGERDIWGTYGAAVPWHSKNLLSHFQRCGLERMHSTSQFPGIRVLTSRVLCHVVGAYSPGSEYMPQPVQQETWLRNKNSWLT